MSDNNSLVQDRDLGDPGDDTLLRYRYQHAYGVSLLVNCVVEELDYVAIWCEQQEDFLAEVDDNTFDVIQVKTRNEGEGYWNVGDQAFVKAIHRFSKLQESFGKQIRSFCFVSNIAVEHRVSKAEHSPELLVRRVKALNSHEDLNAKELTAFGKLSAKCPASKEILFETLSKITLQVGPPKAGYESVLAHAVLSKLEKAHELGAPALDNLRDEMIAKVGDASSLTGTDGSEFWSALQGNLIGDPQLRRKRISKNAFSDLIGFSIEQPFRYLNSGFVPGFDSQAVDMLCKKLEDGDVSHQIAQMKSRALAAEQRMQELALLDPDAFTKKWNQLVGIVHAECSEAYLESNDSSSYFGEAMMKAVLARLDQIAKEQPNKVFGESKELLVGTVGMLTGECAVGWSSAYPVREIEKS